MAGVKRRGFFQWSYNVKIGGYIEILTLAGAINDDFEKWPVLVQYVWPNNHVGNSYNDAINYLKT